MSSTKEIKRRIKSIKSTKKITKAMELVSASKMKRAVSAALSSRAYAGYSWEILTSVARNVEEISHPLFAERPAHNVLLVLITSDRGLCGAYNSQIAKKAVSLLKEGMKGINVSVVTVGKKGDLMMRRLGQRVVASFTNLPNNVSLADIAPIAKLATDEYSAGDYDRVFVAYTDFVSVLSQKPNIKQVIPVSRKELRELMLGLANATKEAEAPVTEEKVDYLFEGDRNYLIGSLAEKLIRMQIYQMMLESGASEQSARMMAMKNANEAAGEMIDDLTLVFNKARQAGITKEISEISAGMVSISQN